MSESDIANNLTNIRKKIELAAKKFGRDSNDIGIIAVTKNIPLEHAILVTDKKILNFAENRVQEFLKKYDIVGKKVKWHFIGRLQTNKLKYILDKVDLIHSVDRMDLVREISKKASFLEREIDILIQVNISGEETKAGISKNDLDDFLNQASRYPYVKIKGLMTMAPHYHDPEDARWIFREMYKVSIDINNKKYENVHVEYLSMGMSNDYEIAIEEGANIVRLGSAIFG